MTDTLAFYTSVLHRRFTAYSTRRMQALGVHFGSLFVLLYIGRHPGCTQSRLTADLGLDWGHSQRTLLKLAEDGFIRREKQGRAYCLDLCEKGREAFDLAHQLFFDWDRLALQALNESEQAQLLGLLRKITTHKESDGSCTTPCVPPSTTGG